MYILARAGFKLIPIVILLINLLKSLSNIKALYETHRRMSPNIELLQNQYYNRKIEKVSDFYLSYFDLFVSDFMERENYQHPNSQEN